MIDYEKTSSTYVVKSKKGGNEFSIQFPTIHDVADYVETETNVLGVWHVTVTKLDPNIYTRRKRYEK